MAKNGPTLTIRPLTPKLWPDFTKKDLFDAAEDFGNRNRRYGAV